MGLVMLIAVVFDVSQKTGQLYQSRRTLETILGTTMSTSLPTMGPPSVDSLSSCPPFSLRHAWPTKRKSSLRSQEGYRFHALLKPYRLRSRRGLRHDSPSESLPDSNYQHPPNSLRGHLCEGHRPLSPDQYPPPGPAGHFVYVETWSPERLGGYTSPTRSLTISACGKNSSVTLSALTRFGTFGSWTCGCGGDGCPRGPIPLSRRRLDTAFTFGPAPLRRTCEVRQPWPPLPCGVS